MEALELLFAKALKLEPPWMITKIDFHEAEGETGVASLFLTKGGSASLKSIIKLDPTLALKRSPKRL